MGSAETTRVYEFGAFRLDAANGELLRDGKHVPLTRKCFQILRFLVENPGRMLKKKEIIGRVWTETYVEEANLAQHIYMIRRALREEGGDADCIETVPKYGYRFAAGVRAVRPEPSTETPPVETETVSGGHEPEEDLPPVSSERSVRHPELLRTLLPGLAFGFIALVFGLLAGPLPAGETGAEPADIGSISVIPFRAIGNGAPEVSDEGLALALADSLGRQDRISVRASGVSNVEPADPAAVGSEEGVDAVLTGTVQREKDTVRIVVQLIRVRDGRFLWAISCDGAAGDPRALRNSLSEQLAGRLAIELKPETARKIGPEPSL